MFLAVKFFYLILSTAIISANVSAQTQHKKTVVKVGLASNFTDSTENSYNAFGKSFRQGATLALSEVNKKLESKNLKIEFTELNYASDFMEVKRVAKQSKKLGLSAVIGYEFSDHALIAAPIHTQLKIPMLSPSATADRLSEFKSFVHLGSFSNSFQGKMLARESIGSLNAKTVLTITPVDCAYCTDLRDAFIREYLQLGGNVVRQISVIEDRSTHHSLKTMNTNGAELIFVPAHELSAASIINNLLMGNSNRTFIGGDGWRNLGSRFFAQNEGRGFKGFMIAHWLAQSGNSKSNAFVSSYKSLFKQVPTDTAALAYDSVHVLGTAIEEAKTYDGLGIEAALRKIKSYGGVTGKFTYPQFGAPHKPAILMKSTQDGFKPTRTIQPINS